MQKKLVMQVGEMHTRDFCLPSLIRLTVTCVSWPQPQAADHNAGSRVKVIIAGRLWTRALSFAWQRAVINYQFDALIKTPTNSITLLI